MKIGRPKSLARKLKFYEVEIDMDKLNRIDFTSKTKRLILELCFKQGVIRLKEYTKERRKDG